MDGWECTGGDATTPDTCTEICGDGLDWGSYQCDDGNAVDGDGCGADCMIEGSYTCTLGDQSWPDICVGPTC